MTSTDLENADTTDVLAFLPGRGARLRAVVLGGSAGAVRALGEILPALPAGARVPVIVVVHLSPRRESLLPSIFGARCPLPVREPEDKEPVAAGTVWIAPPDYHLLVERDGAFALSLEPPVNFSRPSIDALFESAADAYGPDMLAVVLSGANEDGAEGARRVREAGGWVVVQDPEEAESRAMPEAALRVARPHLRADLATIARIVGAIVAPATSDTAHSAASEGGVR